MRPSACRGGCIGAASSRSSPSSWSATAGLAQVVVGGDAAYRAAARGDARRGRRTGDRQPAGPRRRRGDGPDGTALSDDADTPPVELWRPTLNASLPVMLDHAAVTWRHPLQRAKWGSRPRASRGSATPSTPAVSRRSRRPSSWSRRPRAAPTSSRSTFGRPAYLAQSPQFFKQVLVGVFERVYEVGPVFRAEPHDTVRHLAEYVSLDVELGFIGTTAR